MNHKIFREQLSRTDRQKNAKYVNFSINSNFESFRNDAVSTIIQLPNLEVKLLPLRISFFSTIKLFMNSQWFRFPVYDKRFTAIWSFLINKSQEKSISTKKDFPKRLLEISHILINADKIVEKNFTETQTQQVFQREIRIDFKSMSFIYMCESQPLKKVIFSLQSFIGKLCTMKIFNVYLFAHYLSNKRHLRMLKRYQTYIKYFTHICHDF